MKPMSLIQKIVLGFVALVLVGSMVSRMGEALQRHKGALAIVTISGPIQSSQSSRSWSASDSDDIASQIHKLSEDDDVKAILLRINSPGGSVGSVQEIDRELARCKSKGKKIVASLGDVAASGGYYLAARTDRIVSNPGTIIGSIGVILEFGNLEGLFQKVGFKMEVIKSGIHKDIGSPARALTPEEKKLLQDSIDDAYAQFVDAVRDGRHLTAEQVKSIADGRIFTARQGLRVGLVDEMGNQEDAVQVAIRLAKLPAKPYIVSDNHRSLSSFFHHAAASLGGQPLESIHDVLSSGGVEYRWRP